MRYRVVGVLVIVTALVVAGFLALRSGDDGAENRLILGNLTDFPPGSVVGLVLPVEWADPWWPLEDGSRVELRIRNELPLWVVRNNDGSLRGFLARDPFLGCRTNKAAGTTFADDTLGVVFADPCHGSRYRIDGSRIDGPSPRGLDGIRVFTDGESVVLDPTELTKGS